MLAKYDDKINEMGKKLKKMMAHRKQMARDFNTTTNQFILKWISNKNGTARYRHLRKGNKANHPVKTIEKDDRKSCLQCSAKRR
ncbi:unnamed protein product [Rotaria socialis]|uniref:Uncharacterized protein n=2 Tax=Rotaria socialis TaxID=392032 RepID=A0A820XNC1_9BILA|nr:unnamed protein product [Rotaria socialis]CAF4535373.1 unnamed protein product [Rotaria socialis]